ncbi:MULTISPECIES: alpha/beta fold hydrolase [Priestia]|uniref:alpha/beta fold hydrolase n=1 Tax=Priestia TaxID=2800373 RepID=UPI00094C8B16|nr:MULTISPECIES: alpha/beta hydrolase [Priestia]MBY0090374.1 alpha/beta hydrolase [Priestia aryabhattai]MBY0101933.1 alpha/beta hydrolase [Priestia aryabhattai]MCM3099367.1 alpha/beta hydrolase [Priestia megaterium]MCM3307472.1 alpha/beta hydrolase [Priestia megaterium]MED4028439.1 alpha/beta hydrolase [Priestia megaterium]
MTESKITCHQRTFNGVNVYYECHNYHPDKPAIVFIHGFLSSSFSFRRLIPLFEDTFSIITLDLPPFGRSEKSLTFQYSYKNLAKIVIELIEYLKLKDVVLSGHSMGGQVCLNVAKLKPSCVSKLVLLCSSAYLGPSHYGLVMSSYVPFFYLWVKTWLSRKGVLGNLQNVVFDHQLIDEEMIDGYTEPFLDDRTFMALTRMIRDREGDLSSKDLQHIKKPSLLIWGEEDRVVPLHLGRKLKDDLTDSTFISLKEIGHLLPEECPDIVQSHIVDFLYDEQALSQ